MAKFTLKRIRSVTGFINSVEVFVEGDDESPKEALIKAESIVQLWQSLQPDTPQWVPPPQAHAEGGPQPASAPTPARAPSPGGEIGNHAVIEGKVLGITDADTEKKRPAKINTDGGEFSSYDTKLVAAIRAFGLGATIKMPVVKNKFGWATEKGANLL